MQALRAGKHVFVEKPLALDAQELRKVLAVQHEIGQHLIVGFNRRFAPLLQPLRAFLAGHRHPLVATYRINAGIVRSSPSSSKNHADHVIELCLTGGLYFFSQTHVFSPC